MREPFLVEAQLPYQPIQDFDHLLAIQLLVSPRLKPTDPGYFQQEVALSIRHDSFLTVNYVTVPLLVRRTIIHDPHHLLGHFLIQ